MGENDGCSVQSFRRVLICGDSGPELLDHFGYTKFHCSPILRFVYDRIGADQTTFFGHTIVQADLGIDQEVVPLISLLWR